MGTSPGLVSFEHRIANVIRRANDTDFEDSELRAGLARYATVLVSGFLEESVRHYVGTWCRDRSHPHVARYVEKDLDTFWNPKLGKILDLLGKLSPDWRNSFESCLTDEEVDHINSTVSLRNQIAHGGDVGVTPLRVKALFSSAMSAMEKLDDLLA